jgi:hypothetical protein
LTRNFTAANRISVHTQEGRTLGVKTRAGYFWGYWTPGVWSQKYITYQDFEALAIGYSPLFTNNEVIDDVDEPWEKVRSKLADHNLNFSGYIGEFKESLNLIGHVGKTMKGLWDAVHGRFPRFKGHDFTLDDIAHTRLASQFALSPLLSDLSEVTLRLKEGLSGKFTMKEKARTYRHEKREGTVISGGRTIKNRHSRYVSKRIILFSDFSYDESHGMIAGNPFEALWEAIPFSFLVDWAWPIGDWLGRFTATRNHSGFRGVVQTKVVDELICSLVGHPVVSGYTHDQVRPYLYRNTSYTRTPFSYTRIPYGDVGLPRLKNPLASSSHFWTGLALLVALRPASLKLP